MQTEAFQVPWRIKAFYAFSFVYNIAAVFVWSNCFYAKKNLIFDSLI